MREKMVHVGCNTTCSTCNREIRAGDVVLRRSERAVTFRERLHMGANGEVSYYHHPACRQKSS